MRWKISDKIYLLFPTSHILYTAIYLTHRIPISKHTFIAITYPQQIQGSEFYLLKFYINCLLLIQLHDRHVKGTHSEKFQPIQVCCTVIVPRTRTLNLDIENIKVLQFLI